MAEKFTLEEHEKRMRELLKPKPIGGALIERLREAAKKPRLPRVPRLPRLGV